jgi:hypothetical protein
MLQAASERSSRATDNQRIAPEERIGTSPFQGEAEPGEAYKSYTGGFPRVPLEVVREGDKPLKIKVFQ